MEAGRGIQYTKLRYDELKELMEKKLACFKKGLIPHSDRCSLAESWSTVVDVSTLDPIVVTLEANALAKRWERYNVPVVGSITTNRPAGVFRWMYCQLNSASSQETVRGSRGGDGRALLQFWQRLVLQGFSLLV